MTTPNLQHLNRLLGSAVAVDAKPLGLQIQTVGTGDYAGHAVVVGLEPLKDATKAAKGMTSLVIDWTATQVFRGNQSDVGVARREWISIPVHLLANSATLLAEIANNDEEKKKADSTLRRFVRFVKAFGVNDATMATFNVAQFIQWIAGDGSKTLVYWHNRAPEEQQAEANAMAGAQGGGDMGRVTPVLHDEIEKLKTGQLAYLDKAPVRRGGGAAGGFPGMGGSTNVNAGSFTGNGAAGGNAFGGGGAGGNAFGGGAPAGGNAFGAGGGAGAQAGGNAFGGAPAGQPGGSIW